MKKSKINIICVSIITILTTFEAQTQNKEPNIALVTTLSGEFKIIGENIKKGFLKAVSDKRNEKQIKYQIIDDQCNPQNVKQIKNKLEKIDVIVGTLCFNVAREISEQINVPIITLDTRNRQLKRIREYHKLPVYELSPAPDDEARAIIENALPIIEGKPFAIIDDQSTQARNLSDNIKLIAEEKGIRPVAVSQIQTLQSNYRPAIQRMQTAGARALIVIADENDVQTIINDIKNMNVNMDIIIAEQTKKLKPQNNEKKNNIIMVSSQINKTPIGQLITQKLNRYEKTQEFFEGYALLQIAVDATERQNNFNETFDTILGKMLFNNGRANHRPFQTKIWDGNKFVSVKEK